MSFLFLNQSFKFKIFLNFAIRLKGRSYDPETKNIYIAEEIPNLNDEALLKRLKEYPDVSHQYL